MKKCLICILWVLVCLSLDTQAQVAKKVKVSARERLINEYYMMADSCLNNDNYSDAIVYAQKGIREISKPNKHKTIYFELRETEVLAYGYLAEYDLALSILQDMKRMDLDSWSIAKIYWYESFYYEKVGNWSQTISSCEKCLKLIGNIDDTSDLIIDSRLRLARSYTRIGKYEIADQHYSSILRFVKQNSDNETILMCCAEIYEELRSTWNSMLVIEAISELVTYCEEHNYIDEDYCFLLLDKGINFQELGNFLKAYDNYNNALEVYNSLDQKNYYEDFSPEHLILSRLASVASRLQKYDEAYRYFDNAILALKNHSDYLFQSYKDQIEFERAIMMTDEGVNNKYAVEIFKILLECETAKDPLWKAAVYYNLGNALDSYDDDAAYEAYNNALTLFIENQGEGIYYAKTLNRLARILHERGEKVTAVKYFELAIEIFRHLSEADNYSLVLTLTNAAHCAYNSGNLGRAIAWAEESRALQKTTNVGYADLFTWSLLLDAYAKVNNWESYKIIYDEYKTLSKDGILIFDFFEREINRLCNSGDIEGAIEYINKIDSQHRIPNILKDNGITIEQYISPKENYRFDNCMESWKTGNQPDLLLELARYFVSLGEFESANSILKSIYDTGQIWPRYLTESFYAASRSYDFAHSKIIAKQFVEVLRQQFKSVIGMSRSEKEAYWKDFTFLKNLVGMFRDEIQINKELFDISLVYKNFLINSEVTFLRSLEISENETVRNLAKELRMTKELLTTTLSEEHNIDSLKLREVMLNRQVIQNLNNLSDFDYASNVCCDSIAKTLLSNEVAIEIVDYSTDNNKYYVALLMRKDWNDPVLIELGDEAKFLALSNVPVKKLYDPSLSFSSQLYELVWEPIIPYLNKADNIYISPSGLLSTLAIEAVSSADGVYISDIYDIKRVSSTAYVLERENEYKYNSSCVFGGVQYDSKVNTNYSTENCTWDSGYLLDRSVYEDIPYLPGTKKEAEIISGILADLKGEMSLHIGVDANEYTFKDLSGKATEIIHIATHGFYIPKKESNSYRYYANNTASLAMERSGLMLAGANDAWNGILTPGVEDGILTASEIAELDLSKTSLVVMSACETGLGDITEDGIEGLQRAFKSAGVETLVMSLWKVDDKATELLMEEFYKLLIKGYSKDDAFQSAKAKVRSKKSYSSPYYWASFIMLD